MFGTPPSDDYFDETAREGQIARVRELSALADLLEALHGEDDSLWRIAFDGLRKRKSPCVLDAFVQLLST